MHKLLALLVVAVAAFAFLMAPATAVTPTVTVTQTSHFTGGLNTNSGSIVNISAPSDPKLTMRATTTAGGASYARGIVPMSLAEGDAFVLSQSVLFRDTSRYVSVARFDNYDPYAGNGSIFGIERWSNNTLHVVSSRYDRGTALLDLVAPNLTIVANRRYDFRLEAKLSSGTTGYTRLYVDGVKVAESTAPNNEQSRTFTKLRAGVVAVGTSGASVDFGSLSIAPPGSTPPPTC